MEYLLLSDKIDEKYKQIIDSKILSGNKLDFVMFYSKRMLEKVEEFLYPICEKYIGLE